MFQEAGIYDYEPPLLLQMCDIAYSLTKEVLLEARSISEFCGKKQVDKSDVEFALKAFSNYYEINKFTQMLFMQIADEKYCKDRIDRLNRLWPKQPQSAEAANMDATGSS
jgi:hypothetical protein